MLREISRRARMTDESEDARQRLARLSSSARAEAADRRVQSTDDR
jgi:hypothetical protein